MIKIALAYDFEELSNKLIKHCIRFATALNAQVCLIHIAVPDPHLLSYQIGREKSVKDREAELRAENRILHRIADQFKDQGIVCEVLMEEGSTIEGLREQVQKIKADYLLIGHHREKGFFRNFLGNSARKLIDRLDIPIIVVPLKD